MEEEFIEVAEVAGACTLGGSDSIPLNDPIMRDFLGGDDMEINPNTYIIGGCEYVFDDVKFAFLQHLYDIENGIETNFNPDEVLNNVYTKASDLSTVKHAAKDIICGFECFVNQTLVTLERAGKLTDVIAVIPPKPDFCRGDDMNPKQTYKYLSEFKLILKLANGNTIDIKFNLPEPSDVTSDVTSDDTNTTNNILINDTVKEVYDKFKETENKGKKMLSELAYIDKSLHLLLENINKLREIITTQI